MGDIGFPVGEPDGQAFCDDGPAALQDVAAAALHFGHADIVRLAVERIRQDYAQTPDPAGPLSEPFTLKDLRDLHEAVVGRPLMRDTCRRLMEPQLTATGQMSDGGRGRPSRLWRRER